MKMIPRTIGLVLILLELISTTGCVNPDGSQNNTASGALLGGVVGAFAGAASSGRHGGQNALLGAAIGAVSGAIIGSVIDSQQRAQLRQQSPQTLRKIEHNDSVVQQQQQAAQPPPASGQAAPPPPVGNVAPITVNDIKAMTAAGVKPDAITKQIEVSRARYSSQDIATAQQANVDPSVIQCMKSHQS